MSDSKKYLNLALIIFMALTCIVKCAFTIWGKNYLYADGASYCYEALRNAGMSLGIEGRNGSIVLMQLPMYIGFKLGITNINILCALFGFGAAVWYPLFTLLAIILACRKGKTEFAAGLAVLYVLIDVYSGFFTQIESITGVGVFVFLLMYYLAAEKNDWVYRVIASLLLFIMPNANEYFVGYGVVLLAVLVTRLIRERKNVYIIESVIHIAVVVWTIYSSYLAATQGAPTASLRMSVENLPYKKYYWIMLALVFASALLFLLAGIFSNVLFRILAALFAWGAVLWLGITVKDYTTLIATRSFSMRIMNLVLPCLCGGVIWLCWTFRVNMWDKVALFAAGMLILNSIYVCKSTGEYGDYLSQISAACDERQGFFTVYETNVDRTYMWGWSLPMEGVLAQCLDGKTGLKSVMIKGFDADWWESFDSDDINAYGDFSRYGITFDFGNV